MDGTDGIPRTVRTLWGQHAAPRRGPKPGLTLQEIGAAALAIADEEGLPAVSMSRVAKRLGFTTMSLYRYVERKDELWSVVLDEAYGQPKPLPRGDWRRALTVWGRSVRDRTLAHPWILQVPVTAPPITPHQTRWMEMALRGLDGVGLSEQDKLSAILLVDTYVRGQAAFSTGAGASSAEPARMSYARQLRELIDPADFPALTAALSSGALEDEQDDWSRDEFEFGLQVTLDGIAALVERRTHDRHGDDAIRAHQRSATQPAVDRRSTPRTVQPR